MYGVISAASKVSTLALIVFDDCWYKNCYEPFYLFVPSVVEFYRNYITFLVWFGIQYFYE
jgi:hypothetical protein